MMRARLLIVLMMAATLVASASASTPGLRSVLLRPSQIGPGYKMGIIPHGDQVDGTVTLDLCGFKFPSEALRVARLQAAYSHAGKAVQLSNEVVEYAPKVATEALREVRNASTHCPKGPVSSNVQGVGPVTYGITKVTDRKLLPGYVAMLLNVTYKANGQTRHATALAVYQVFGDILSAVYTDGTSAIADQIRVGLRASEQSAINLRRS